MREFQERRRIKKLLHSRYAIAVLVIIFILVSRGLWNVYVKYEKSRDLMARTETDVTALQDREASLQRSIDVLSTPEGKEKEALDRFGAVKEGEHIIVLVDDSATNSKELPPADDGWWSRFFNLFGF